MKAAVYKILFGCILFAAFLLTGFAVNADEPSAAYEGFKGKVGRTLEESQPSWRAQPEAPSGAPNVIIILADDMGFSDLGCYGSEIKTPNLDKLAENGVRFNQYTTHPLCSPTRAALLTGRNAHAVGAGWLANNDPGYPGYGGEIDRNTPTIAEILRENGYTTMMVGKWHNTLDYNAAAGGDNSSWPPQRGFDYSYYFMEGETSFWAPSRLQNGNDLVDMDQYPEDYYATDDWTDRSIQWITEHVQENPKKPFFLYLAHNAVHIPLHAKEADMEKYRGVYDKGWDQIRQERYERQLKMGIIPGNAKLAPRNPGVKPWEMLTDEEKKLFVRLQQAYAGMLDNMDQNVKRLNDTLQSLGVLDNTIIIFLSDNGGAPGGGPTGEVFSRKFALLPPDEKMTREALEKGIIGGPRTYPGYPWGWAQNSNTPFTYYKQFTTNGGLRVPMIVSWPKRITSGGEIRTQFAHVTDIVPTLLEVIGIDYPGTFRGVRTKGPDGKSLAAILYDGQAAEVRSEQYYELGSNRGYVKDGWKIVSLQRHGTPIEFDNWMLFSLKEDFSEVDNLAGKYPDKVKELAAEFDKAAWANKVYPLDNRGYERFSQWPPHKQPEAEPRTFFPGTQTTHRTVISPLLTDRSFTLTTEFTYRKGDQGVLVAVGDTQSGFVMYVENDCLHFAYNAAGGIIEMPEMKIAPGELSVALEYEAPGKRQGFGRFLINGKEAAPKTWMGPTLALGPYEGLDVGIDRRSPAYWRLYEKHGVFPYTNKVAKVTITPGKKAPDTPFGLAK